MEIEEGKPANLLILPAENSYDAIRRQVPVRYSLRQGRVIAETKPSTTTLTCKAEQPENITFKMKA